MTIFPQSDFALTHKFSTSAGRSRGTVVIHLVRELQALDAAGVGDDQAGHQRSLGQPARQQAQVQRLLAGRGQHLEQA